MPKPIPIETRREARRLRVDRNLSTPQIAKTVGISNFSTYAILRDLGPWQGRSPSSREYAATEIAALYQLYPRAPRAEIEAALPGRAWDNIIKKANALRLKRVIQYRYPANVLPVVQELRAAREAVGLGRPQLARLIGCNPQQLTAWELAIQWPTGRRLTNWARVLGFDLTLRAKGDGGDA